MCAQKESVRMWPRNRVTVCGVGKEGRERETECLRLFALLVARYPLHPPPWKATHLGARLCMCGGGGGGRRRRRRRVACGVRRAAQSPNFLVTKDWTMKLSDFGESRLRSVDSEASVQTGQIGTHQWMAPEVGCGPCGPPRAAGA